MGIYITQPSSDKEDIGFIQELIRTNKAYINNGKVYRKSEESDDDILWESCDQNAEECIETPWGYGKFTSKGYTFLFIKLQSLGRTSSTYL